MVLSVGGTPAPIILSLNQSKPEYVSFFTSRQTKKMLEGQILPALNFKPRFYDWIVTPNAELLLDCYSILSRQLHDLLEKWEVDPRDVCVDYTGGTKTMSVALALATIENSCCYSYVGGDERSKGGVGVVLDGKEKMWFLQNPWDEIALSEKREASILFNKARYASAAEVLEKCIERVGKEKKPFFNALAEMVWGFYLWDRFKHKEAKVKLYRCRDTLRTFAFASQKKEVIKLVEGVEENTRFLEGLLSSPKPSKFYFCDLLANAGRRAKLEQKFDDAVARLYRAIEVLAQAELREVFEIDTSNVKEESIPAGLHEEFLTKYQEKEDAKIRIPLFASYRLLAELGSPLGKEFFKVYEEEMKSLLDVRNSSIVAHGLDPVGGDTFDRLFESTLKFSGTEEKYIPQFPVLVI